MLYYWRLSDSPASSGSRRESSFTPAQQLCDKVGPPRSLHIFRPRIISASTARLGTPIRLGELHVGVQARPLASRALLGVWTFPSSVPARLQSSTPRSTSFDATRCAHHMAPCKSSLVVSVHVAACRSADLGASVSPLQGGGIFRGNKAADAAARAYLHRPADLAPPTANCLPPPTWSTPRHEIVRMTPSDVRHK